LPPQNTATQVGQVISDNAASTPSWFKRIDDDLGHTISSFDLGGQQKTTPPEITIMATASKGSADSGYLFVWLLAVAELCIGLLIFAKDFWRLLAIYGGAILALLFWVFGQNFGGLFLGLSTDPNSGPLIILLAIAILGIKDTDRYLASLGEKIERYLIGAVRR
jgi:hypothetical protein